ncbi:MAG TPA: shikimate dehydrogenase [Thermomicrobiales bacterium]|nr:shikimate dehydrogenase [Thermomicrobiales bacterium]
MCESESRAVGLIGNPVAHSLSPAFQQAAFDACELPLRYELWQTETDEIPERLRRIRDGNALGANVTVPHKEAVTTLMDDLSQTALRIGAVNTVIRNGASLIGDNTDAHGFIVPLREGSFEFDSSNAVIVGAGGAARAVVVALLDAGIRSLAILNRNVERARRLATQAGDTRVSAAPLSALGDHVVAARLIVNATSVGWSGEPSPVELSLLERAPRDAIAYDLTYRETAFLTTARAAGLATIDGLPMLVHQGARSFELWTGVNPPVNVMWEAAVLARAAKGD